MSKKFIVVTMALLMVFSLAACKNETAGGSLEASASSSEASVEEQVKEDSVSSETEPESSEASEGTVSSEVSEESSEAQKDKAPSVSEVDAKDASEFNTKENAVPLGQWVYYTKENYTSKEFGPFYVRITGVNRDQKAVEAELEAYDGIMDFTLSEDQARDIEYGIVEYEIYFAPDYAASEYGITVPSVSWGASPLEGSGFKTDGGMSYIGVGSEYELSDSSSEGPVHPGSIVSAKGLFSILKNYDESEYVFEMTWYDGEIETENARDLYFALK